VIKVLFRVDDGPGVGAGHVMRCLALAEALAEIGGEIRLVSVRDSVFHDQWKRLGAEMTIIRSAIGDAYDLEKTVATARCMQADWVVVDGYGFSDVWLEAMERSRHVLCLDDIAERDPAVSLILNQNAGADQRYAEKYQRCGKALLGLSWALLRRDWLNKGRIQGHRRILLTLGGEDPSNRTLLVMEGFVADGRDFTADVVYSTSAGGYADAQAFAEKYPARFVLHKDLQTLAPLMGQAAVVICGGGVTSIEALSLGVVPVILILAENQRPGAQFLSENGLASSFDLVEDGIQHAVKTAFDLLDDETSRLSIATRCRHLVDGKSVERVVNILKDELT
jgi:UDP-2,4-diacetamido-2,4,6-trideoxy-beta-L-altropyranose hydrolase